MTIPKDDDGNEKDEEYSWPKENNVDDGDDCGDCGDDDSHDSDDSDDGDDGDDDDYDEDEVIDGSNAEESRWREAEDARVVGDLRLVDCDVRAVVLHGAILDVLQRAHQRFCEHERALLSIGSPTPERSNIMRITVQNAVVELATDPKIRIWFPEDERVWSETKRF